MNNRTLLVVSRLLDILLLGAQLLPEAREASRKLQIKLHELSEQGRDPTPHEWDELILEQDTLLEALRKRAAEAQN